MGKILQNIIYLSLLLLLFVSCGSKESEIFGVYENTETGDRITIDCDYNIALPEGCCPSLPLNHKNKLTLSAIEMRADEFTMYVNADSMLWPIGEWNKSRETMIIGRWEYAFMEALNCPE